MKKFKGMAHSHKTYPGVFPMSVGEHHQNETALFINLL